ALAVDATIAGRPVKLNWAGDSPPRFETTGPRRAFDGFLQPAGIVDSLRVRPVDGDYWFGDVRQPWPSPKVTLRISYPGGRVVRTQLHIDLNPGWG
ncbi:MAG: hypothetical protein ACRDMJ_00700, partial [Solirubrobacteraceae bacterium]